MATMSDTSIKRQLRLQRVVDTQHGRDGVHEIAVSLSLAEGETLHASAGVYADSSVSLNTPYFLASTAKLYATTLIMQLCDENLLHLNDLIVGFFPGGYLDGLHCKNDRDFTHGITVEHLLAHTSGVADYFEDKRRDGTRFADALLKGEDAVWTVDDVVAMVRKELQPHFPPGKPGKAHYSDSNYQLLGAVIEAVTGVCLAENIRTRIAEPLGLTNTWLFTDKSIEQNRHVLSLRNGNRVLHIPQAMASVRLDGGMVSTSAESLNFIKAFMAGELFAPERLSKMQQWNSVFFPIKAGVGLLKFELPWILRPFQGSSPLIGHSGISGAFAFYSAASGHCIAGTVNQLAGRRVPYTLMLKALRAVESGS